MRILVVDDEVCVVTMLVDLFEESGCEVATADDGYMALQRVMEARPDAIVLDLRMPHMDGFEAARRLRTHPEFCSIPIVGLTGLRDEQTTRRALAEGIDLLLHKPVDAGDIVRCVLSLAGRAASAAAPVAGPKV
jgi:CheY-like chemotaxis protein